MKRIFFLLLLTSTFLQAQIPSVKAWISDATEIEPGIWMSNAEVSIRDYQYFQYYLQRDSGEAMWAKLLPSPELRGLGFIPASYYPQNFSVGFYAPADFSVEVDHPVYGLYHAQAEMYAEWLSQHYTLLQKDVLEEKRPEMVNGQPALRFRLPTKKEWLQAAALRGNLRDVIPYKEAPSRYLKTRSVKSSNNGNMFRHLADNVSEMTNDPKVVMGGNFEREGFHQADFDAENGDLRLGFRLVLEMSKASWPYYEIESASKNALVESTLRPRKEDYKKAKGGGYTDEFYPFNLEKSCVEIEPNIWLSKNVLTADRYAYFLYHYFPDKGALLFKSQLPNSEVKQEELNGGWESITKYLPKDPATPIQGLDSAQFHELLICMTDFYEVAISPPGLPRLYWFREATERELESARRAKDLNLNEKGFRYVVEVMPQHPDAAKFKAIPKLQVEGRKPSTTYPGYPEAGK